jgi:hypothetical protein
LLGIWNDAFHATGGNEFVGRSLAHRLHCLGTKNVTMKAHVEVARMGDYRRTHLLSLIESMRELILASGQIADSELRRDMSSVSDHLSDPRTTLIDKLVVQAWGQRAS